MIYVFDTSSLRVAFRHYYRSSFPSFWDRFDDAIESSLVTSVREVLNEINSYGEEDELQEWAKGHREIYTIPTDEESAFTKEILAINHFQALISQKNILSGKPVADPFVIAKAKISKGTVVTQEIVKPQAAKIPNICEHFQIPCCNLEEFMTTVDWRF